MSDDGRLTPAWGAPAGPRGPEHGLAGLFDPPEPGVPPVPPVPPDRQLGPPPPGSPWTPVPPPPDPALLAAQHQAQLEASAAALAADELPRSGGAHRARRQPARYILPAVGAAIAVLLIGVGVSGWFGANSPTASTLPPTTHQSLLSTSPLSATPTPTPTPTVSASKAPAPTRTARPPAPAAPPVVHAPAVVLNETAIRGLAAHVAAVLRTKHWVVTGVGNWFGQIASTTVYYPPGMEAAARSLAYDLGVSRIRPSARGMLADRLTVVLTGNPY